ncbi:hypothetical protein EV715DRAFT_298154 [Schizophyllum commune]
MQVVGTPLQDHRYRPSRPSTPPSRPPTPPFKSSTSAFKLVYIAPPTINIPLADRPDFRPSASSIFDLRPFTLPRGCGSCVVHAVLLAACGSALDYALQGSALDRELQAPPAIACVDAKTRREAVY